MVSFNLTAIIAVPTALGFILMELGRNREAQRQFTALKSMLMVGVGVFMFWIFGYGFAFGDVEDEDFAGDEKFAGDNWSDGNTAKLDWMNAVLLNMLGIVTVFSAAGSLTGRADFHVYMLMSFITMTFIYPFAVAWNWA
jgi:Amt family ammonium transporter